MTSKTSTKSKWRSWLIYTIIFIAIFQGANWWKTRDAPSGNISSFSGQLMDGTTFTIADFSGSPVLFHFWATWCPLCDLQKGSVQSIAKDYPVITIASWSGGDAEVKTYMQDNQLSFSVMLDNSGKVAQDFGVKGVPASFILDPSGEIKFVETGYSTELGLRFRLWLASL